jgi:hypothetical protein
MNKVGLSSRVAIAVLSYENDKRLFLFRNNANQVHMMTYPKLHTIFFASQSSFLENSLKSVYGNDAEKMARDDDISIDVVPDWKSLEFILDKNGLPILHKEEKIELPSSSYTGTFSSSYSSHHRSSYTPHTSNISSLPVVYGRSADEWNVNDHMADIDKDNPSTKHMLGEVSPETREVSIALARSVRESTKVLREIRNNRFMQHLEWEHFKKNMNLV